MKKNRFIVPLLIGLLLFFVTGFLSMSWQSSAQDAKANAKKIDPDAIRDALRHGGVREAARLTRHYVADFDPHWDFGAFNVEQLTKNSAAIVVGVPVEKLTTHIAHDANELIVTDYEVVVHEVIKGSDFHASTITISLIGGRVEFEDGTSAEIRTPKFEHVKIGNSYAFFLDESSSGPNIFTLTGGPQGLVEFDAARKVKSHGRVTDPIAREKNDVDKDAFLKEVREKAKKWPNKGKCCS